MPDDNNKKNNKNLNNKVRKLALRPEDKALWTKVANSIRPLRNRTVVVTDDEPLDDFKTLLAHDENIKTTNFNQKKHAIADNYQAKSISNNNNDLVPSIHLIDHKTQRKIASGKLAIDRRLDLHGLSQDEAHFLLLRFLQSAQFQGSRHVLIITGKGNSPKSQGILRQLVPKWLSTPAFRIYISAMQYAGRQHGGYGAIYVKLRKLNGV